MEKSSSDSSVKEFDLRLCIFWRKIHILLRTDKITKEILSIELFEFISAIICLLKKNDFSKFAKLVMILFILFHFEQMLDKYEQINYNDQKSIKLMFPLFNSKIIIVEDLL